MRKGCSNVSKSFLALALVMLFLFGNTSTVMGITNINDKKQTTDTFTSLGGDYSIQYILGNYGVFSFKDITGSHIVGPVIAGDKVYKTAAEGNSLEPVNEFMIVSDLSNGILSYVGEITKRKGETKPTFEMNHTYSLDKPTPTLYTRYSDMNVWQDGKSYKLYKDNKNDSFLNPNNSKEVAGTGPILQNDEFINFEEVKKQIKKESSEMLKRPGRVVAPDPKTGYLEIEAGYNYIINDASSLRIVDFKFPEGYDGVKNIYPYPTFINFTASNLALSGTEFSAIDLPSGYVGKTILPEFADETYQFFPDVYVNGAPFKGTTVGSSGNVDFGENLNILWNMPNINTLDGGYKMAKTGIGDILGHIIAPDVQFYNYKVDWNGDFRWSAGNMNGAAIVDSWYGGRKEVHYWPYLDDLENPIFKDFSIKGRKSLKGRPLEGNDFRFKLELISASVDDGLVSTEFPEVTNNADGTIYFPIIEFKKGGTYEFIIKEVINTSIDKITFDKSEYKLVVEVTENHILDSFDISYELYKVKDEEGTDLNPIIKVEEIEFNNIYDYTLPETGGIGNRGYSMLGVGLMISSLMVLVWKRL